MRSFLLLIFTGSVCLAQMPGLPGLGWVQGEEPGRYQRVVGIPGAAQLQEALPAAGLLAVRPGAGMAVRVSEEGVAAIARLDAAEEDRGGRVLPGAVKDVVLAAWSPSGDALLLAGAGRAQVWRVSDDGTPELLREMELAADKAAVSDGGGQILARIEGVLYWMDADGSMMELSRDAGAFTFIAGSRRYAWIEGSTLRLGGPGAEMAPVELEELENGARLLASAGRGMLLLAESAAGESRLRLWDSAGDLAGEWRCPAEIAEIRAAGVAGVLHLAAQGRGPVWMADLGAVQPSVFFVPGNEAPGRQGGEQ